MDLYIQSPIHLYGVLLNYLSTGTISHLRTITVTDLCIRDDASFWEWKQNLKSLRKICTKAKNVKTYSNYNYACVL